MHTFHKFIFPEVFILFVKMNIKILSDTNMFLYKNYLLSVFRFFDSQNFLLIVFSRIQILYNCSCSLIDEPDKN